MHDDITMWKDELDVLDTGKQIKYYIQIFNLIDDKTNARYKTIKKLYTL